MQTKLQGHNGIKEGQSANDSSWSVKPKADFLAGIRVHMSKVLLVVGLGVGIASLWRCLTY
ncbi:hypothetical protein HanHA300_Chr15g0588981 [Helianthus annuus]|nr:hypothetical protein HanHA300_Chr15g0588981 [Helianthus annuus]KAJ0654547.1 hypothetical protein HanOQP8_Chr15g0596211 [Helianthus annuus]